MCAGNEVNKELCDEALLPGPVSCVVPCPNDCVLSPWTSWSTCSQTCSSKSAEGKQTRTRAILAYSAREGNGTDVLTHPCTSAVLFLGLSEQVGVNCASYICLLSDTLIFCQVSSYSFINTVYLKNLLLYNTSQLASH